MPVKATSLTEKASSRAKTIATLITSLGVIAGAVGGAVRWGISEALAETNKKIDNVSAEMSSIKLDTMRMQLLMLISDDPTNHGDILKVAKVYFVDLDGDWVATETFLSWAKAEGVDVSGIMAIHDSRR